MKKANDKIFDKFGGRFLITCLRSYLKPPHQTFIKRDNFLDKVLNHICMISGIYVSIEILYNKFYSYRLF